jgi:hypothetical protein
MRRIFALSLIALALPVLAQVDYHKTVVTRWSGPGQPLTYDQYRAANPEQLLAWSEIGRVSPATDETGPVLVVVESTLQTPLALELDRYMDDLADAGWEPILLAWSGGTAENLRTVIQQYQVSDSILGAVLIGNLPQAWYELYEDWDNDGLPDEPVMVQFPCDLYFMDLDGSWYDGTSNGILDTHLGPWPPDIFVGRLHTTTLSGNPVELMRNYLDKNHAFRSGQLYLPGRGLAYIDDDWAGGASQWAAALAQGVGLVDQVSHPDSTRASDYLTRLDDGYYAYLLASHSWPQGHSMKEQGGTVWNNVLNTQITQADPQAFFYNLFCCSASRFCESGYLSGCYLFADTWGLEVLGSAKTGSMLYFEDYYSWIQQGECQGEAFRRWFGLHGQEPGSVMWAMSWFYGMCEMGDPTLFMKVGIEVSQVEVVDDGSQGSQGDGDGIPDAGETIALNLTIQNNDPIPHNRLWVRLYSTSSGIGWLEDSVYVGNLPAQGTAQVNGFTAWLSNSNPDSSTLTVSAQIQDDALHLWGDTFTLTVRSQKLVLQYYDQQEISGDGDPYAEPGEIFNLNFTYTNSGGDESDSGTFTLTSSGLWIDPQDTTISFPPIAPGVNGAPAAPLRVEILSGCPNPYNEILNASISQSGPILSSQYIIFSVGTELHWTDAMLLPTYPLVHYPVTNSYQDQWHVSDTRYYSPAQSRKCGSADIGPYAPQADGALETPLFWVAQEGRLTFQHWIAAEEGYDGGIVEINSGSGWERLTPVGGYPGNSQGNGSYPGGPCYNGQMDWSPAEFDLGVYSVFARLRFRFASDVGTELEGWYLDDITLDGSLMLAAPEKPQISPPLEFRLCQNHPNPFNATTAISYRLPASSQVDLRVYDLTGRLVAALVDGRQEAGSYEVIFDGGELASGLYFVRLQVGEYEAVKKMMLLK